MVWTCSSEFFGYVYNEIEKENTMNIQIFGTKKCNDTKKAERFFKERGIKFQFIDMKEKVRVNLLLLHRQTVVLKI